MNVYRAGSGWLAFAPGRGSKTRVRRGSRAGCLQPSSSAPKTAPVDAAVAQQEAIGVDVITDGELRRALFIGPLTETVDGFGPTRVSSRSGTGGRRPVPTCQKAPAGLAVTGQNCGAGGRLRPKEFTAYLRARRASRAKVTLPSPLMLALLWSPKASSSAYPDPFACSPMPQISAAAEARKPRFSRTYIQIDAPELQRAGRSSARH